MSFSWLKEKPNTLRHHLDHPEISPADYFRERRISLGHQIMSMCRIYLDTNYWVCLRKVLMGKGSRAQKDIFDKLKELRDSGKAICPVSYSVYVELLRQTDAATRLATARAIDIFGDSSCIQPPHEVLNQEILAFVFTTMPHLKPVPVTKLIWTKVSSIVGERTLKLEGCPPDVAAAMAKAMDDLFWSIRLEEMITQLPADDPEQDRKEREQFAGQLTRGKNEAHQETDSFDKLFLDEVTGGLEAHECDLGEIMVYLSGKFGHTPKATETELKMAGHALAKLIRAAFECRRISTEIPGIHIPSGLHAAVRHDKQRKYKDNDCEDFRHAVLALPYFDIFCTEKSLRHLLCHKPLQYDQAYGTRIVSDDAEVLDALKMVA